jgi:uncharacterized hydrophobic protein (TIGR00341 family)
MRFIQLLVSAEHYDDVVQVLRDENIDYVATPEVEGDGGGVVVHFPLPTQAVDSVLDALRAAGLDEDAYTVIATAETARTQGFEELERRFVEGDEEDDRISNDEIRTKAKGMTPGRLTYYAMTLLSALVATAGLLLDSAAVVVGSMVIAPQVGSALTAAVGSVLGDEPMLRAGVRTQILGLAAAILAAAAFGWTLKTAQFVPPALNVETVTQISARTSPGLLSVVVAVAAGAAGAFGLATEFPVSLVGVAVAAAIVPAAAAVGIGIAWGYPVVALGAFVLLAVNAVCINLSASAVFWGLGYRPTGWERVTGRGLLGSLVRSRVALAVAVVLVVAAAGPGVLLVDHVSFENDTKTAVQDLLGQERYTDLELRSVHVAFSDLGLTGGSREVTVVVSRPDGSTYPGLPATIATAVETRTGVDVSVSVEYVATRTAS